MKYCYLILFLFISIITTAQTSTLGKNSPIIKGANNKIKFIQKIDTRNNIPPEVAKYIAGLLFSNHNIGSNASNIQSAASAWIKKYIELRNIIKKVSEMDKQKHYLLLLNKGEFITIEKELKIKTNYSLLSTTFPNTFYITSNQNPIIIGNYDTVTYVVNQIVHYNLPEGFTPNLINELKVASENVTFQQRQVHNLLQSIHTKDQIILDWVDRFRQIKNELAHTQTAIGKKAYQLLLIGDLDGALKALKEANDSMATIANNCILQAQILSLGLNASSKDSILLEIAKLYKISINISPRLDHLLEYAHFLIRYSILHDNSIIYPLYQAKDSTTEIVSKVLINKCLAYFLFTVDKTKSIDLLNQTLELLQKSEPLKDSSLLDVMAETQHTIGFIQYNARCNKKTAINALKGTRDAINTIKRISPFSCALEYKIKIYESVLSTYYLYLKDTLQALEYLNSCRNFFEHNYIDDLAYFHHIIYIYQNLAELSINNEKYQDANSWVFKAIEVLNKNCDISSPVYIKDLIDLYSLLIKNYTNLNDWDKLDTFATQIKSLADSNAAVSPDFLKLTSYRFNSLLGSNYLRQCRINEAIPAIRHCIEYYTLHPIDIVSDRNLYISQLILLTACYQFANKIDSGILFCKNQLPFIITNKAYNDSTFQNIEWLLYTTVHENYIYNYQYDSAQVYIKKALALSSFMLGPIPASYMNCYTYSAIAYFKLLKQQGKLTTADSLLRVYMSTCAQMSALNSSISDYNIGEIGKNLVSIATVLYDNCDYTNRRMETKFFRLANRCLSEANKYHKVALQYDGNELNHLSYLIEKASMESKWATICSAKQRKSHLSTKDYYIRRANRYLSAINNVKDVDSLQQIINKINN